MRLAKCDCCGFTTNTTGEIKRWIHGPHKIDTCEKCTIILKSELSIAFKDAINWLQRENKQVITNFKETLITEDNKTTGIPKPKEVDIS